MRKALVKSHRVRVGLGSRSYDVRIGSGILESLGEFYHPESKRAILVSDVRLTEYRARVMKILKSNGWTVHEVAVEAGESLKNLDQLYPIFGEMIKAGLDRSSTLFALGGGTIGDAAGFVASTYLRGIAWVGLPTTLLAQVDSSVGGKTAVNHPQGKNLIGTFHQPALVVCETDFLKSLSQRELISGFGEVVKYGLTFDRKFFEYLRESRESILARDPEALVRVVKTSIAWKAKAVQKDEFDRRGVREVLNFGHTFGHALETVTNYESFQHGEAVLWGMRFALALSKTKRKISEKAWREADEFLRAIPLPALPSRTPEQFFAPMVHDKKSKDGKVRFVLMKRIGETVLDRRIETADLMKAFEVLQGASESRTEAKRGR